MTENEFLGFLNQRGRARMLAGSITIGDCAIDNEAEYINGHALLPKDYDNLSEEDVVSMGGLLFQDKVRHKTKEAILILLAHQVSDTALTMLTRFNLKPDKELEVFAKFALEESLMWNE